MLPPYRGFHACKTQTENHITPLNVGWDGIKTAWLAISTASTKVALMPLCKCINNLLWLSNNFVRSVPMT